MGLNFYCHKQDGKKLHVGKASAGWVFSLHVYDEGPKNIEEWLPVFALAQKIECEYGEEYDVRTMIQIICCRSYEPHQNMQELCVTNRCELGPNNLFRSKIDGVHCVGHGNGTYDYMKGDFT